MESTCSASSSTISPFSSSPITGKKFSNRRTFCLRESVSPPPHVVPEYRSFAYSSNTVSERAGSKSNTYAFSLRWYLPFLLNKQGLCARNAACTYSAGLFMFDSMSTPVHSGTVTPVVSWPTDKVMVFVLAFSPPFSALAIASRTLSNDFSFSSSSSILPSPAARMIS